MTVDGSCDWIRFVLVLTMTLGMVLPSSNHNSSVLAHAPFSSAHIPQPQTVECVPTLQRISVASDGRQANGTSINAAISADGRSVAFTSAASNLVPGDTNEYQGVFVYDPLTRRTTRVSVAADGTQALTGSDQPAISADGRYVAFASFAPNLVSGDTNGVQDIFIHDTITGMTTRISVAADGTQANADSYHPAISADGRYVVFMSYATNLVPGDTNNALDIFVRNITTHDTTRVSVASDGTQANHHAAFFSPPSISADGRYVAFASLADNLIPADYNGAADIFVHDTTTRMTTAVSLALDGTSANGESSTPSISGDGRYVAFASTASNLVPGDTNGMADIFVRDTLMGVTRRISIATDGTPGNSTSGNPAISADGTAIAFVSGATNLVAADSNDAPDIFVHTLSTGETCRVSRALEDVPAKTLSNHPSISAGGQFIVFESDVTNIVSDDTNGTSDIFLYDACPVSDSYTLSGRVVDSTNTPVTGVTISAGPGQNTVSGPDGAFTLTRVVSGTYTLVPSKSGYTFSPLARTIQVPPDATGLEFRAVSNESTPRTLVAIPLVVCGSPAGW